MRIRFENQGYHTVDIHMPDHNLPIFKGDDGHTYTLTRECSHVPKFMFDRYKTSKETTVAIPAIKNANRGDTVKFKLSIPRPGGTFAGGYTVPVDPLAKKLEWKVVYLEQEILQINPHYGREELIKSIMKCWSWCAEIFELDAGIKLELEILNGGDYEPTVRDISYANNYKISDTLGDILLVTTDIPDYDKEINPRVNNMLAYMHEWSADTKIGDVGDKGMTFHLDKFDHVKPDHSVDKESWSLDFVVIHEMTHMFGLDHLPEGNYMSARLGKGISIHDMLKNRLLDQWPIRVIWSQIFGYDLKVA